MRFPSALVALVVLLAVAPAGAQTPAANAPKVAIEKGSTVKLEYTLKDDKGQLLDTSDGKEPISFVQGAQQIIPGLDKAIVGMKAGDTKVITATFPADYPMHSLAGKTAEFEVSATAVAKPKKPDVDEDFAKGLGAESLDKVSKGFGVVALTHQAGSQALQVVRQHPLNHLRGNRFLSDLISLLKRTGQVVFNLERRR